MASDHPPQPARDVDEAARRVRDLSDRMIELARLGGLPWLAAYERVLESMLRLQRQAMQGSQVDWIGALVETNADFVREMSQVYLETIRRQATGRLP